MCLMKAIVYEKYGSPDVLEFKEVEKPVPGDDQVLIEVRASSVNAFDWRMLRADPFVIRLTDGLLKPKQTILGVDVAGRVEAVGPKVTRFEPGDEVFGDVSGLGGGGFAEYVCAGEELLAPKPAGMAFDDAAAVPMAAVTALHGLRDHGGIRAGQKVLINGASGGVGTFAVQIAKSFDAEVTAVCSTRNLELAHSIGADHVIDYRQEDFTKSGRQYDLILGANGKHSIWAYRRALRPDGTFVMSGGSMAQLLQVVLVGPLISMIGNRKMRTFVSKPDAKDLAFVAELIEAGKIAPVIDKRYPLREVPEAIRYLEEEHARGKVSITFEAYHKT